MVDDEGAHKVTAAGRKNGLAGIGDVSGAKLSVLGYTYSYQVLGQFLSLDMDEALFTDWLKEATGGKCTSVNREKCYAGVWLYCDNIEGMLKDSAGNTIKTAAGKSNGLVGVGNVSGAKLTDAGFVHTHNVLGTFLLLDRDQEMFTDWLNEITDGKCTTANRDKCFAGLARFCRNNL